MNRSWIRSAGPTFLHPVMTLSIGLAMMLQRGSSITTITTPKKLQPISDSWYLMDTVDPLRYSIFMNIFLLMLMLHMNLAKGASPTDTSHAMSSSTMFSPAGGDHRRSHQGSPVDGGHLATLGAMQMAGR